VHEPVIEFNSIGSDATGTKMLELGLRCRTPLGFVGLIPNNILCNRNVEGLDVECDAYQELGIVVGKYLVAVVFLYTRHLGV